MAPRAWICATVATAILAFAGAVRTASAAPCPNYPYPVATNRCVGNGFCGHLEPRANADDEADTPPAQQVADDEPIAFASGASIGAADFFAISTTETRADRGVVAVVGDVDSSAPGGGPGDASGGARSLAVFRVTDLVISGPAAEVETSLRLHFDARTDQFVIGVEGEESGSTVSVLLGGGICSPLSHLAFDGTRQISRIQTNGGPVTDTIPVNDGALADVDLDAVTELVQGPFMVPTNEPLQLELWLYASAAAYSSGGDADVAGDYRAMLGAGPGEPIFDLPAGYSVNSAQANIVANTLPEPAGVVPAIGTLGVVALRRRRSAMARRRAVQPAPSEVAPLTSQS